MRFFKSKLQIILSCAITILAVAAIAGATTIGTNISTDGNIIVTGNLGIGTTSPVSKLDIQGEGTTASIGSALNSVASATCTADGACFSESVSVMQGRDYLVTYDQTNSIDANGSVTPYLGTVAGIAIKRTNVDYEQVLTANTTGAVNFVFTVTGFTSGTISLTNISLKLITSTDPVFRAYNSNGSQGVEIRSGGSGLSNTFIGRNAGKNNTTGYFNVALGTDALFSNTSGSFNNAIGYEAMKLSSNDFYSVAIGMDALKNGGDRSTAVGHGALANNTTGWINAAFGYLSMISNTTGSYNTAIGPGTLYNNLSGSNNTVLGHYAAQGTTGLSDINNNTLIGYQSGIVMLTGANNNVFIGHQSGKSVTTGAANILLGFNAGDNLTTGSSSIIIGNDIDATSTSMTRGLNIGNLIFGTGLDGTGTTLSSGNIGIGTTAPQRKLQVSGGGILLDNDQRLAWLEADGTTIRPGIYLNTNNNLILRTGSGNAFTFYNSGLSVLGMSMDVTTSGASRLGINGTLAVGSGYYGTATTSMPLNGMIVEGNVGIGTTTPAATLDIEGYMKLKINSSQPVACSANYAGSIAVTSTYRTCICNGGSGTWVYTSDGVSACVWQ